jgi:hypothetical protein
VVAIYVGGYRGPAVVDGYTADIALSAVQQVVPDGTGGSARGAITWSGTAIILDLRAGRDLLELAGTVDIEVGARTARAAIVDANPGSRSLQLQGSGDPPFDLDPAVV